MTTSENGKEGQPETNEIKGQEVKSQEETGQEEKSQEKKAEQAKNQTGDLAKGSSEADTAQTKTKESVETAPADQESIRPQTSREKAKASRHNARTSVKKKRPWGMILLLLVLSIVLAGSFGGAYYGRALLEKQEAKLARLQQQIAEREQQQVGSKKDIEAQLNRQNKQLQQKLSANQTQITDLEQRVIAQGKRLRAMSDTSREDWLLAEAEYLLKLANQRVRIERSAEGSEALLEEADAILRDMDDPDLHRLRRAIAQDLAALRLINKIDLEGLYLSLVALTEQVENLPLRTRDQQASPQALPTLELEEEQAQSYRQKVAASWGRFTRELGSYFKVHSRRPSEILDPQASHYLQHNLRLILERAQLALLREQQDIYRQSLEQADALIEKHYVQATQVLNFRQELARLSDKQIVQQLPDISTSLHLLHEYIEDLHQLKGLNVRPGAIDQGASQ